MTMVLNADDFAQVALGRLEATGLLASEDRLVLPDDYLPALTVNNHDGLHRCEVELAVHVDPFLVVPVKRVFGADHPPHKERVYSAPDSVRPYWVTSGLLLHFEWQHPDPGNYRPATLLECVCAMAQHQRFGSFRTLNPFHTSLVIEACFWERRLIKLHASSCLWFGDQHHRFFVRFDDVPACSSTRDLKMEIV